MPHARTSAPTARHKGHKACTLLYRSGQGQLQAGIKMMTWPNQTRRTKEHRRNGTWEKKKGWVGGSCVSSAATLVLHAHTTCIRYLHLLLLRRRQLLPKLQLGFRSHLQHGRAAGRSMTRPSSATVPITACRPSLSPPKQLVTGVQAGGAQQQGRKRLETSCR